jgi:hypothetical protein
MDARVIMERIAHAVGIGRKVPCGHRVLRNSLCYNPKRQVTCGQAAAGYSVWTIRGLICPFAADKAAPDKPDPKWIADHLGLDQSLFTLEELIRLYNAHYFLPFICNDNVKAREMLGSGWKSPLEREITAPEGNCNE